MYKLKRSKICLTIALLLTVIGAATPARAIYVSFGPNINAGGVSGSDIVMLEQRFPYWNGGYFTPWENCGFTSSDGVSGYFYNGTGQPNAGAPPNVQLGLNWSFWPLSNPINISDTISSVYSSPSTFSMKTTAEGTIFRAPGQWAIWNTNVWYRWTIRTWQPVNGTPHQGYSGSWLRDGTTGKWYHMATVQLPFAVTGLDGLGGFNENASGSATPQRTDYRNAYVRLNGVWKAANYAQDSGNSTTTENFGLIENNTACYQETCENNSNYVGTLLGGATGNLVISNQPPLPTFDPIVVTNYGASVTNAQLLVQWQMLATSSPQFAYQINVYTNASYTGPVVTSFYDIAPEARQKLLTVPVGVTLYPQLTIIDVFNQTNLPISLTVSNASLSAATAAAGAVNGLNYAYYQSANNYFLDTQGTNWSTMPNFATVTPVASGAVSGLDLSPRKRRDGYAFNYTGYINVPTNGIYAFTLNSDAGSKLYVDGQLVINWDGRHSPSDMSGWVGLQAGFHTLNVQYFCDTQSAMFSTEYFDTLSLSYEGPGISNTEVPVTAFYRVPGGSEPTVSLTPTNGAVVSDASVPLNATVTANGNTINKVVFYNDNYYWAQDTTAPYSLNSFFWANMNNPLRARLFYNGTNTIDSSVNLVTTFNMSLAPWLYAQAFYHNTPNGASVQNGTYSLIGDGVNLLTLPVNGDCTLIAHLAGITSAAAAPDGSTANTGWQAGIIFRGNTNMTPGYPLGLDNTQGGSTPFVALFSQVDGNTYYQDGNMKNGGGGYSSGNLGGQKWFKLVRISLTNFTSYVSANGTTWTLVNTTNITLATNVFKNFGTTLYAGFVTYAGPSSNPNVHWASFDNASLTGNILGPPTVSVNPSANTVYAGQNATFSASPFGTAPFTYQWQLNGVNIAGATNATLTLTNLQPSASGLYGVLLGNTNGTASASGALTVLTPSAPVETIITNNPLGYWRLNETAGPTANDSVGSFNGTGQGSVLFGVPGMTNAPFTGFESGNLGAQFNGDSSPSDIAIPAFNVTTTNFTITGWANCNGAQDSNSGLVFSRGSGHGVGLMVVNNGGNELRYSWNDNGNDYGASTGLIMPSGKWAFVALTITPSNAIVYMATNSTLRSWTNTTANIGQTFAGNFYFGCDANSVLSASRQFNGALDEIAIYNRTLSQSQISQILSASQTATPPAVSLTSPANGASYAAPANISLSASVVTNGHSITSVHFYNGSILLGQATTTPYTYAWNSVPAGTYSLLAQVTYDSGKTASSVPVFVTVNLPPLAPTTITPTAVSYNSISVTWPASANASGYILNRNGSPIANVSGTSYSDTGLTAGTTYSYFVIATNAFGISPPSVTNSATTSIYGPGLGLNFARDSGGVTTGTADGLDVWDNVYDAGGYPGTITLTGSSIWIQYAAANSWWAGNNADSEQRIYATYLDDGDGGTSLVAGDGIGASVTISNLNSWVTANGGVGVKIRCYAASDTSGATFRPVSVRRGAPNPANGTTQLTSLPVIQTVTIPVLGGGNYPTDPTTDLGHPRGYADTTGVLTNDAITLTIPSSGSGRGPLAAIKLNVVMPVPPTTFTLTYSAGANGSLSGTTPQTVNSGGSGSAVTAVANSGYVFTNWSDGLTFNPRTDANVTSNITVTANFVAVSVPVSAPWTTNKVGSITAAVKATVSGGSYSLTGGGSGISGKNDDFWSVSQACTNDVTITVRVVSQTSTSLTAQAGVMIRETLATGSRHAFMGLNPVNGANYIRRSATSGNSSTTTVSVRAAPYWVQLVRSGNTFTGSISSNGVNWVMVSSATVAVSTNAQVGLAVCAASSSATNVVVFDNVNVSGGVAQQPPAVTNQEPAGGASFAGVSREVEASRMVVNGTSGDVWLLETSADMRTWQPLQIFTLIDGQAEIEEGDPDVQPEMFFRVRSGN